MQKVQNRFFLQNFPFGTEGWLKHCNIQTTKGSNTPKHNRFRWLFHQSWRFLLAIWFFQIGKSGLLLLVLYLDISINCDIQNCHNKYLSMVGYRVGGLMRLLEYTGSLLNCQFCQAAGRQQTQMSAGQTGNHRWIWAQRDGWRGALWLPGDWCWYQWLGCRLPSPETC